MGVQVLQAQQDLAGVHLDHRLPEMALSGGGGSEVIKKADMECFGEWV